LFGILRSQGHEAVATSPPHSFLVLVEEAESLDGLVTEDDEEGSEDGLDEAGRQSLGEDAHTLLAPESPGSFHKPAVLHLRKRNSLN